MKEVKTKSQPTSATPFWANAAKLTGYGIADGIQYWFVEGELVTEAEYRYEIRHNKIEKLLEEK